MKKPRLPLLKKALLSIAAAMLFTRTSALLAQDTPGTSPSVATTAAQLSQFGITWTFDQKYPVGQFVNGDWWVVGPVKITKIDPASVQRADQRIVNGSMVNPIVSGDEGFDSHPQKDKYKPALNVALGVTAEKPLVLAPGSSLLSAISRAESPKDHPLEVVAILTVLDATPPADAFRPPYMAVDKKVRFRYSQVDTSKLTKLPVAQGAPPWEQVNALMARPFIDFAPNWNRYHIGTRTNGATYGRDVSRDVGRVSLMLLSDYPLEQKRTALIGMIQRGIDLHGIFAEWQKNKQNRPFPWGSDGGHSSGRKWPMIFAGALLGDRDMQDVGLTAPGLFHEDNQTVNITQQHIDLTNSDKWKPPYDGKRGKQPYSPSMLGMPEWVGSTKPEQANAFWSGHPYRLGGNQHAFYGVTLSVLAMGLREKWNHDVWFDYQTRYAAIMESQPDPFAALLGYAPVEGSVKEGGWPSWQKTWDQWQYDMWKKHWPAYYKLPTAEQLRGPRK